MSAFAGPDDNSTSCFDAAKFDQDYKGGELATECLYVQWRFSVTADFAVDEYSLEGQLTPGDLVTASGKQITAATIASGYPGTVDT